MSYHLTTREIVILVSTCKRLNQIIFSKGDYSHFDNYNMLVHFKKAGLSVARNLVKAHDKTNGPRLFNWCVPTVKFTSKTFPKEWFTGEMKCYKSLDIINLSHRATSLFLKDGVNPQTIEHGSGFQKPMQKLLYHKELDPESI